MPFQNSLVLDLVLVTFNDSCLVQPGCKLPCQKLVTTQPIEAKYFVLEDSVDEATEGREGSNAQLFDEKWCFLCIDVKELSLGELLAEEFKMFVHDFASLELLVVEVHHCSFEFGDVV